MSGIKYLADTNIIILLTSGNGMVVKFLQDKRIAISFITEMELLSWPGLDNNETKALKRLMAKVEIIEMNSFIKEEAIRIRRSTRMKLPDAIIAATSKQRALPLVTADKDFEKVKNVSVLLLNI